MSAIVRAFVASAALVALLPAARGQDPIHSFSGSAAIDRLGSTLASPGDVDGDGLADLIVGAPFEDANGLDAGSVRVLSGEFMISTFAGNPPAGPEVLQAIAGGAPGDNFGTSVAAVGDVDGDGRPDWIAGAPFSDLAADDAGAALVVSGATGAVLLALTGDAQNDWFGYGVAGIPDVDNDGFPDVAASALSPNAVGGGIEYVRVHSGNSGALLYTLFADPLDDGQFGYSMAGIDDLDQDGAGDLLVGERNLGAAQNGRVRLFSGASGALIREHTGAIGERLGTSVAPAGDLDGDGTPDYASGGPGFQGSAGRVRAWSGADGTELFEYVGADGDLAGGSVAAHDDLDQDGTPDLLIGAPGASVGGDDAGAGIVVSGADAGEIERIEGAAANTSAGWAVASMPDLSGDGLREIAVGAPFDDTVAKDAGRVTVYTGGCGGLIEEYGSSCPGSGGFSPHIALTGCMKPGGTVTLRIEQALGPGLALLVIGLRDDTPLLLDGCFLNVDPIVTTTVVPLGGNGAGQGVFQITGTVPAGATPGTAAMTALCADPAKDIGFTMANGVEFTIPN